jgi:hypothetical protein
MKTEEDEAFDDLARRQGMWGGGFPAKRAAAVDKLQEPAQEQEEDWGALAEKQLASIKRDTQASLEDAMVRATHKVMIDEDDDTQVYKKPWVGLTDEQRLTALKFIDPQTARLPPGLKQFAESIEQLLKEKNT